MQAAVCTMQEYGDIRTFYTALSQRWVLVGYYDLFAAKLAKNSLNGQVLFGARVEASFSAWKEAREHNEGGLMYLYDMGTIPLCECVYILLPFSS